MKRLRRHTTPNHGSILNVDCDVSQIATTTRPSLHSSLRASIQRREEVNSMNVSTSQTFTGNAEEIFSQIAHFLYKNRRTINTELFFHDLQIVDVRSAFRSNFEFSKDRGKKKWTLRMVADATEASTILVSISSEDIAE